uniref:Heme peroxidase n=1 Tax=Mycena chlorophos TaxID=658473 RepID=A0ABQ0L7H4_MYCCL|nr:heme peroxidase [Mycena chlorophos]
MSTLTPLDAFEIGSDSIYLSRRGLPKAPDGHYDWENREDPEHSPQGHAGVTNLLNTMETLKSKGNIVPSPRVVAAFVQQAMHPDAIDDRQGAFQGGLDLLSRLPSSAPIAQKLSDKAIGLLYNTLPHPRAALIGPVHEFRQADGGGNNLQIPDLGRAGTPYARSVQGKWCYAPTSLPDPGLVFDMLLKARGRKDHPGGNSGLTFAFASIATHSLFRTDLQDWSINTTSSYLDLSPLYGIDQAAQDLVRNKAEGRGLLYPDTFSEERLLFLPPAPSALLVLFNRNHNYIADMLLKINERGQWLDPPPSDAKRRALQDEQIFQTARLVNCGHLMRLVMSDYVAGFLGLSEGNAWSMDPFDPIKDDTTGVPLERGLGNHCSVEFNLLYRWHPTLSADDQKWTEDEFSALFNKKPFDEITLPDFFTVMAKLAANVNPDPKQRTFGGLTRGPDGLFSDDDLARVLHDANEAPAGAYGAQRTPECLRIVEILGIMQARRWGVCTMNEFRKFLGLKQFADFEEWNSDAEVVAAARQLYGHIDNLELYTGLQCEDTMPLSPGLRLAGGYTMTRAVLGDAINLIRGDRFYTSDFTPANLTAWGYQDSISDPHNGGFGAALPKLLMRALPRHYPYNSVYTCFPFFTPQKMRTSLTKLKLADQYTFTRPIAVPITTVLNNFAAIDFVFKDPKTFPTPYDLSKLGNGYGFMLAFDTPAKHDPDYARAAHALYPNAEAMKEYSTWYAGMLRDLLKQHTWRTKDSPRNFVDITRNVINLAGVHWATDKLCGITLKTPATPKGLYTEQEMYDMFALLCKEFWLIRYRVAFLSAGNQSELFSQTWAAFEPGGILQALVADAILAINPHVAGGNAITDIIGHVSKFLWPPQKKPSYAFLSRMIATGRPLNELVANVVSLAIGSSVTVAQAAVHVVDFYLDDRHSAERAKIIALIREEDPKSTELLHGYIREAMRLNPQFTGLWRNVTADASIPQGPEKPPIKVKAGARIWASFRNAHLNPHDFPNPTNVDPKRPKSSYRLLGAGFHHCLGATFVEPVIAEVLKVIFGLKNVRRAPGDMGRLAGFTQIVDETPTNVYLTAYGGTSAWPGSMTIQWDDEVVNGH